MRRHGVRGLVARRRQVQTTDSRHPFPVVPNRLDRQFTATTKPDQVRAKQGLCPGWRT